MHRPVLYLLLGALVLLAGCKTAGRVDVSKLGPPPSTQELAALHNSRIEPLGSLWARVSVRAKGVYDDGSDFEEQGEGHLQIVRPDRISLTIGKLGETYFAFGANETRYWSFDLSDSDHKTMLIGNLSRVTPEKAAALGLPVHPSELITLTGIAPIDVSHAGGTRWSDDGKLVGVSVPSRWGRFTLWIDPRSGLVTRAQVFDEGDALVASAELSRYKAAAVPGHGPVLVPGKVEITTPDDRGFVRIELSGPESREIRPVSFDPERLRRAYRVGETINLDASFEERDETIHQDQTPPQTPPQTQIPGSHP